MQHAQGKPSPPRRSVRLALKGIAAQQQITTLGSTRNGKPYELPVAYVTKRRKRAKKRLVATSTRPPLLLVEWKTVTSISTMRWMVHQIDHAQYQHWKFPPSFNIRDTLGRLSDIEKVWTYLEPRYADLPPDKRDDVWHQGKVLRKLEGEVVKECMIGIEKKPGPGVPTPQFLRLKENMPLYLELGEDQTPTKVQLPQAVYIPRGVIQAHNNYLKSNRDAWERDVDVRTIEEWDHTPHFAKEILEEHRVREHYDYQQNQA